MSEEWALVGIDPTTPSPARMYDYYLGGKDNFEADRTAAERVLEQIPNGREMITENRRFLGRAVQYLAGEAGIGQFVDIGTGLPTQGNVHEIAQATDPNARVAYVDNDPVVLAHSRALLSHNTPGVATIQADMRDPEAILAHPELRALIDLNQPVAVLFVAVLHFLTEDEDPYSIVDHVRQMLPSGSYLVVSHGDASPQVKAAERVYEQATSRAQGRTRAQIERFFHGLEMVAPGLVYVQHWRPDGDEYSGDLVLGGIGYKP